MFFNALYWTGKKTLWEFIDSYLLPATCLHQDLCAGAQFRSFSVRVASTRAPISSKDDGQPIDSWWFYQLIRWISYMIGLHLTWKLLFFPLRIYSSSVHWVLGVTMISAAFPKGSWLMVQKSFGQPADVVNRGQTTYQLVQGVSQSIVIPILASCPQNFYFFYWQWRYIISDNVEKHCNRFRISY